MVALAPIVVSRTRSNLLLETVVGLLARLWKRRFLGLVKQQTYKMCPCHDNSFVDDFSNRNFIPIAFPLYQHVCC